MYSDANNAAIHFTECLVPESDILDGLILKQLSEWFFPFRSSTFGHPD